MDNQLTPLEQWSPVERFAGCYEVSDQGRVRRLAGAFAWRPTEKLLTAFTNERGYKRIGLRVPGGKQVKIYVHQLVAEAFLGPCPPGREVNHKNGDRGDNRLENLEYLTPDANYAHAKRTGLYPSGEQHHYNRRPETRRRGEDSFINKLTEADVLDIRRRLAAKETKKSVSERYGISITHVKNIKNRRSWSHI